MNNKQKVQPITAIIDCDSFRSDYLYNDSLTELKENLLEKNITLYALTKMKIQDHDFAKIYLISNLEDILTWIACIEIETRKKMIAISKNDEILSIFSKNGFQTCCITEKVQNQKMNTYEIDHIQKIKKLF